MRQAARRRRSMARALRACTSEISLSISAPSSVRLIRKKRHHDIAIAQEQITGCGVAVRDERRNHLFAGTDQHCKLASLPQVVGGRQWLAVEQLDRPSARCTAHTQSRIHQKCRCDPHPLLASAEQALREHSRRPRGRWRTPRHGARPTRGPQTPAQGLLSHRPRDARGVLHRLHVRLRAPRRMSTVIRRKRTSRLSIGPYRRHELLTGRICIPGARLHRVRRRRRDRFEGFHRRPDARRLGSQSR